jgi:hypothetical protein
MEPAKFSNRIEYPEMIAPFMDSTKVKIRCEYNCDCFDVPRPNECFMCETTEPITIEHIYNCLVDNGYSTCCNHNFLDSVFVVSNDIVIPIFGK